jgi:hypothetical protein
LKSIIMVNRTLLGASVMEASSGGMKPDYKKLLRALAPDERDPTRFMWGLDMPPAVVSLLSSTGWQVINLKKHVSGLVECDMGVRAMVTPHVDRFVFVAPSGALAPVASALAADTGSTVVVAGYRRDTARSLLNVPDVKFVDLAELDVTRPKDLDF